MLRIQKNLYLMSAEINENKGNKKKSVSNRDQSWI